jgi:hypothetical protein
MTFPGVVDSNTLQAQGALIKEMSSWSAPYAPSPRDYLNKDFATVQNLYVQGHHMMLADLNRINGLLPQDMRLAPPAPAPVPSSSFSNRLITHFSNRLITHVALPVAITLFVGSVIANVGSLFGSNQAVLELPAGNENCTKTKEQLEKCRKFVPTLQNRVNESMTDWKACLDNLGAYKNSTNQTIKNLTSLLEACQNASTKTVN